MKNIRNSGHPHRGRITLFVALGILGVGSIVSGVFFKNSILSGQPAAQNAPVGSTGVFTPAHPTVALAVRHFFGLRPEPVQPIAYDHSAHVVKANMECLDCHYLAASGPRATIPGVAWCVTCHTPAEAAKSAVPAVQKIAEYFNKGEDIPWQRVYGWNDEAHVRFNHAPHLAASVQCAKCHGDVGGMTVAKRVVDHSMGFCITCHKERKASIDCVTCHF